MCAAKSPISMLQEYAQSKGLSLPYYEVMRYATGFKCIATFGSLEASAIAESKKRAKILCAERLLDMLQLRSRTDKVVYVEEVNNLLQISIDVSQNDNGNHIGDLNELCAKNCQPYPDYKEDGVENMKFVVQCKHKSYVTRGMASTKKQAKQFAAKKMLNRIQLSGFDMTQATTTTATAKYCDEDIIKLMKNLSYTYRKSDIPENPFTQFNNCLFSVVQKDEEESKEEVDLSEAEGVSEIDSEDQPELTVQELKEKLQHLGYRFSIDVFQNQPFLVLILKTAPAGKHPAFTFLSTGDSYKEAELSVLKNAYRNIKLIS